MTHFNTNILSAEGYELYRKFVLDGREPDLTISPDGSPYLYRWHLTPRNQQANVYFHIQVASDPERPLHDHPWDNQSVLLEGHYEEVIQQHPPLDPERTLVRKQGQVVHRRAEEAHRLVLPEGVPYVMTLFTTGPVVHKWGFWVPDQYNVFRHYEHEQCIVCGDDGSSQFRSPIPNGGSHVYS